MMKSFFCIILSCTLTSNPLVGFPQSHNQDAEGELSIYEKVTMESNGTLLYMEIKGKDRTNPVILFLHGGPGDAALGLLPFQAYVGKKLEEDFVIVYLHQRGLLQSPEVPDTTQTIENHISDVKNVVNFLTNKLNRKKISMIGHSWGGLLGSLYLLEDDTKVEKFIAAASPFNFEKVNQESFDFTLKWAKEEQNTQAIKELTEQAYPPIHSFDKLLVKSKWASQAFGGIAKNLSMQKVLDETGYDEFKKEWQLTTFRVAGTMFPSLDTINVAHEINEISIPILFMAGEHDANVPPNTIQEVYRGYNHEKNFVLFEHSHHLLFVDEPELFTAEVKAFFLGE